MRNRTVTRRPDAAFHALADPTRRALLELLRGAARPAGEIAQAFPVSRPAISKHLRVLRQACLVREHRVGRQRLYELDPRPLREVDRWLEQYRVFWDTQLAGLKAFVESEASSPEPGEPHKRRRAR